MKSDQFSSRLGVVLAAAGGAVGLGNIWKFPYMLGQNGGGAFLLVYVLCVVLFGMPLMMMEFMIGKRSGKSVFGAFSALSGSHRWDWLPCLTFLSTVIITGFYCVVTGWCLEYLYFSVVGELQGLTVETVGQLFGSFIQTGWQPLVCSGIAVVLSVSILWAGVGPGIERLSKILMPMLLILLLILIVRVTMLEGAFRGVAFLFASDLSKITSQTILDALGQCFYSLSIAMGALITYGAYMPKNQNVASTTMQIVVLDTLVALLAGCAIFPAVFAFGFSPTEGPKLVFSVLPLVFGQMAGGQVMAIIFFALLSIAAITSAVSLIEMQTAFVLDASVAWRARRAKRNSEASPRTLTRQGAIVVASLATLSVSVVCACSMVDNIDWLRIGGITLFDWADRITSNYTLPLIALFMVIFFGWFVSKETIEAEMRLYHGLKPWFTTLFRFLLRWFIPVIIVLIFLNGIGLFSL
ncbi:MAG: sodium-dependent transporter [Paludibacteraceae bacterium]|nr:sodium-dependent transporter [Paludibacteraceae bacterium]